MAAVATLALWGALQSAVPAPPAERFLDDLRCALARQDRVAVANLFEYPVMVLSSGLRIPLLNRAALLKMYNPIFSSELQSVIAMAGIAREGQPRPAYLAVVSGDGLTIGQGWIWARRTAGRFRIARLILPSPWVSPEGAPPPRRLAVAAGRSTVQVSGMLRPYEMHSYIIGIAAAQRLELRLDGFAGRDVVMRVLDRKTGRPFDDKAGAGTRVWSAKIEQGGDVRVDVLRLSPELKTMPLYVLAAGLR